MEHPREGGLSRATAAPLAERGPERRELELGERMRAAEVVRVEAAGVEPVGKEAGGERRPSEHADPAFASQRQDVALRLPVQQAVLVLQCPDRADGEGALDVCGWMVRDAAGAHLSFLDQTLHFAPRLLDRRVAIDVVQLHEVEPLDAEPA
jgi:hypothetical protein